MSKSQKFLITGGTGFFGCNLREVLRKSEFNYVGVSTSDGDLREWSSWKRLFEMHRPSSVIHLAAKSGGIKSNLNNPYNFFYDNLAMLTNLTRALNEYELEQVVVPIGGCSYPALAQDPISEEELWRGFPHSASAPFSTAKLLSTLLPQIFQNRRINIIVPGNMYGPFDNFSLEDSHVIPGMIRKIHIAKVEKKNEVFFWGSGLPVRDFVFVQDVCEATVKVITGSGFPTVVNLSTGIGTNLRSLATLLCDIMNYDGDIIWDESEPEGQDSKIFSTKLAKSCGLVCKTDLKLGLEKTAEWFRVAISKSEVRL